VDSNRQRAIDLALGRMALRRAAVTGFISSGSAAIDAALGGGYPRGRLTEIFGPASSGKTTLALHALAACQAGGGTAAFLDVDHAFDAAYAQRLGVDLRNLVIAQPDTGEQALEIVHSLAASGTVDLIALDSVAALLPRNEVEGVNQHRRLITQQLRRVVRSASRSGTAILFSNQIRQKSGGIGNPQTPTGGPALGLYAAVRAEIRAVGPIYRGETLSGRRTRVRIVKNTRGPAFAEAEFDVFYGEGIRRAPENA
jgi:recombination protein RecA